MNIKVANKLVELRKKSGLSQEQLADKLGLSRQAVSKWERAEASPDTDNLICLAKLYNVSLDDLLSTDETIDEIREETKEKETEKGQGKQSISIDIDKGIEITDENGNTIHINKKEENNEKVPPKKMTKLGLANAIVTSVLGGIAIILYLTLGFLYKEINFWAVGWTMFLLVPTISSVFEAIEKKKLSCIAIPLPIVAVYCFIGILFGLWHPYWVLFLLIPIYYGCVDPIDKWRHKDDKKEEEKEED